MKVERILLLAKETAVLNWYNCKEEVDKMPNNRIRQSRLAKAEQELDEIDSLYAEWQLMKTIDV